MSSVDTMFLGLQRSLARCQFVIATSFPKLEVTGEMSNDVDIAGTNLLQNAGVLPGHI